MTTLRGCKKYWFIYFLFIKIDLQTGVFIENPAALNRNKQIKHILFWFSDAHLLVEF